MTNPNQVTPNPEDNDQSAQSPPLESTETEEPQGEASQNPEASIALANISDQLSEADSLGFQPYVLAIAEFLTSEKTQPPLTLSVEGKWGSGKSSLMKQVQLEIERIEENRHRPKPKTVWFNAWRHDKVEALWAAFALEFLQQITTPQTMGERWSIWKGSWKLFWQRLKWRENWGDLIRILSLSVFFVSFAVALPVLVWRVGLDGVNQLSDQIVCRLSPQSETENSDPSDTDNSNPQNSEACLNFEADRSTSGSILNWLLFLGGFAGSTTGSLALLVKLGEIVGNPKNDLKQYLESPDYQGQVAFIEEFHRDFAKIVSAYAGKGSKVYVFIDDLDRCEMAKAADLMQGLNLMIANDPHLIFILGMDREKVAAVIALKQKDIMPYLQSSAMVLNATTQASRTELRGLEYGYEFIEKFVQLPFQVPQPSEREFVSFLATLSPQQPLASESAVSRRKPLLSNSWAVRWKKLTAWSRRRLNIPAEPATTLGESETGANPVNRSEEISVESTITQQVYDIKYTNDSELVKQIVLRMAPILDYSNHS
ncbi:hypothetical protein XM38_052460 [Halomicronema hongdechloris C2206]|uniref:KAP NTPase domain-containing protein n=1 Tax=Halomicronema hongdechloris C2206 TaxID=1641165 RepID=A0A1Z3HVD1_9CYAN|nr:P-loop NTPase fold protein [Halomicronema hongdechloris]ASC74271.1 hypothetical protein XM38_052460 [Halomicronema hongdechloris C2206]